MPRSARRRKTTMNLADAYMGVSDALDEVADTEGEEGLHRLADRMEDDSVSTAYSGIGSPEVIGNWLAEELQRKLPERKISRPRMGHQIEWTKPAKMNFSSSAKMTTRACSAILGSSTQTS